LPVSDWYTNSHETADLQLLEKLLRNQGFAISRNYISNDLRFSFLAKKKDHLALTLLTLTPLSEDRFWKRLNGITPLPALAFNPRLSNLLTPTMIDKCKAHSVRLCPITSSKLLVIDPTLSTDQIHTMIRQTEAARLVGMLRVCHPGKAHWRLFEDICQELFNVMFVPPLSYPLVQANTILAIRRRDFIYPNRDTNSVSNFWVTQVLRRYGGEYVLVECKNLSDSISTSEFDQGMNYLGPDGLGNFGIIISRKGFHQPVKVLQTSSWSKSKKMLLVFSEKSLRDMIRLYAAGDDPTRIIQDEIDRVRTSVP
jgi:hypothetical protein